MLDRSSGLGSRSASTCPGTNMPAAAKTRLGMICLMVGMGATPRLARPQTQIGWAGSRVRWVLVKAVSSPYAPEPKIRPGDRNRSSVAARLDEDEKDGIVITDS